ncbi:UNVERIFIED_CONTAM: hypothetical protein Sradi_4013600 [Sesamum radiatum]|uniref:CCHC-type domain-containing protein n=1 Tax=Sesamum radiatum TaxID=300843 RepID=A0AAW2PHG4_SESRA
MDSDLDKLGMALTLTDKEDNGAMIPMGLWQNDNETEGFFVVGRILSLRAFHADALRTTLFAAFNPVKGMEFKSLPKQRFLLKFFHTIDRQRVMEGCPWAFNKNLIVLKSITADENPMHTNLDWCDFHVHAHDLPLSKMTRPVAQFIGNQIGLFKDVDMDDNGGVWGASLRIRVSLNVTQPLPRVLKIRTPLGDEQLVSFTLERLLNFCYLCGCMGHQSKFCPTRFEEGFQDPGDATPYGAWLRATNHLPSRSRTLSSFPVGQPNSHSRPKFIPSSLLHSDSNVRNLRRGADIFDGFPSNPRQPLNLNIPLASPTNSHTPPPNTTHQHIATTPYLSTHISPQNDSPPVSEVHSSIIPHNNTIQTSSPTNLLHYLQSYSPHP